MLWKILIALAVTIIGFMVAAMLQSPEVSAGSGGPGATRK
jgi:hypothetical protein